MFAKEWKVPILAPGSFESCRVSIALSASGFFISSRKAFSRRSFISAAAAFVNVVIRNRSISVPSSMRSRLIRSTSTVVLPEPAAADTRMLLPFVSIVSRCSFVQFIFYCDPNRILPLYKRCSRHFLRNIESHQLQHCRRDVAEPAAVSQRQRIRGDVDERHIVE